ncbi:hypothetical protein CBR_g624 [Chara braunii]|uniref:Strictosidine synthase conserved region domain-containing protein n=1 Tax=Chara braunii TaxID=69332 RepID=A0A388KBT4_CHABU|nr:hypothetical protein CBR_g624 [Chara braunii]|eukprot:GBG67489.1 hypothetical protein CBR_g624 [Chara braunii]
MKNHGMRRASLLLLLFSLLLLLLLLLLLILFMGMLGKEVERGRAPVHDEYVGETRGRDLLPTPARVLATELLKYSGSALGSSGSYAPEQPAGIGLCRNGTTMLLTSYNNVKLARLNKATMLYDVSEEVVYQRPTPTIGSIESIAILDEDHVLVVIPGRVLSFDLNTREQRLFLSNSSISITKSPTEACVYVSVKEAIHKIPLPSSNSSEALDTSPSTVLAGLKTWSPPSGIVDSEIAAEVRFERPWFVDRSTSSDGKSLYLIDGFSKSVVRRMNTMSGATSSIAGSDGNFTYKSKPYATFSPGFVTDVLVTSDGCNLPVAETPTTSMTGSVHWLRLDKPHGEVIELRRAVDLMADSSPGPVHIALSEFDRYLYLQLNDEVLKFEVNISSLRCPGFFSSERVDAASHWLACMYNQDRRTIASLVSRYGALMD